MKTVTVTGAHGFIGQHIVNALVENGSYAVVPITRGDSSESRREKLLQADFIYHLAGANRPTDVAEFFRVNEQYTKELIKVLVDAGHTTPIAYTSSVQAEQENEYGLSKRAAEKALESYVSNDHGTAFIARLTNVFGKWSRPNYNSAVATFCHNIARHLPVDVHDPTTVLRLVYIDDVVHCLLDQMNRDLLAGLHWVECEPIYAIELKDLVQRLETYQDMRGTLRAPDFSDRLTRLLYATFVSFVPKDQLQYDLLEKRDERGRLAELFKSDYAGQIFVSVTRPGVTRGNHYHHTKVEKFCVMYGDAVVRLRKVNGDNISEYQLSGEKFQIVDIPPGWTHSIENVGNKEMVVLFWADEIFDSDTPDTLPSDVMP